MKRFVGSFLVGALAVVTFAQNPFNIVRPLDGSKVRETVKFQLPKNSVPPNSYVGVFVNDRFFEATTLTANGKYYEYNLDTKNRGLSDGKTKFEFVLYTEFGENTRITDRSSVVLNVANRQSITVPDSGIKLRYSYRVGTEWVYRLSQNINVEEVVNNRSRIVTSRNESVNLLYAVDDSYSNGDGLLRLTAIPDKGKESIVITASSSPDPRRYDLTELAPIYMKVSSTGNEVYGTIPIAMPIDGSGGNVSRTDLYASFPLPTLPSRSVRPGDAWQSRFQFGSLNLEDPSSIRTLVRPAPARGEFVGVEWEMGRPCAKIKQSIATTMDPRTGIKASVEETIWFALDRRQVIKIIRDQIQDFPGQAPANNDNGGGGGAPPAPNQSARQNKFRGMGGINTPPAAPKGLLQPPGGQQGQNGGPVGPGFTPPGGGPQGRFNNGNGAPPVSIVQGTRRLRYRMTLVLVD